MHYKFSNIFVFMKQRFPSISKATDQTGHVCHRVVLKMLFPPVSRLDQGSPRVARQYAPKCEKKECAVSIHLVSCIRNTRFIKRCLILSTINA